MTTQRRKPGGVRGWKKPVAAAGKEGWRIEKAGEGRMGVSLGLRASSWSSWQPWPQGGLQALEVWGGPLL